MVDWEVVGGWEVAGRRENTLVNLLVIADQRLLVLLLVLLLLPEITGPIGSGLLAGGVKAGEAVLPAAVSFALAVVGLVEDGESSKFNQSWT